MKILITGACGFIGFHLSQKLAFKKNFKVFGIDNFDNYYSVKLKEERKKKLLKIKNFKFSKIDLVDKKNLGRFIKKNKFDVIFHLAAQAGVRYSIENPEKYMRNNISGFFNLLEISKENNIKKVFYASSSFCIWGFKRFPIKRKSDIKNKEFIFIIKRI